MRSSWVNSWQARELFKESDIRFHIVKILEENPDGLIVTEIHKELTETGFNVSQPNISKHLDRLVYDSIVIIVKKKHPGIGRKLRFFISIAGFLVSVTDRVKDKMAIAIAETLEAVADSAPRFDNFKDFQNFLTKLAEVTGGEISVSDELYEALSARKPYGEIAQELQDYHNAYGILEGIIEQYNVSDLVMEKLNITGKSPSSDPLLRYNLAVEVFERAVVGDEKATDIIEELLQISQGKSREEFLTVEKIVEKYKKR
jgi:hypothetical protein